MKNLLASVLVVCAPVAAFAADPTNTYGVDLTDLRADLTIVGGIVITVAVLFAGFKYVRRMLGR